MNLNQNKPMDELDYVEFYANRMSKNNKYFTQQKMLIDSQIKASASLFQNRFKKDFKKEARIYLKEIGLL